MRKLIFLIILFEFIMVHQSQAQRFSASAILGLNMAQIDGDDLAGYSKLGISAGIHTKYWLKDNRDLIIELLYNQVGSKSAITLGTPVGVEHIGLNYIDMPIYFRLKDWKQEDGSYKVFADGGLNLGRLVNSNVQNSFFAEFENDYNKNKLSFLLGVGLNINSKLGFSVRFTRDITSIYRNQAIFARSLIGYFITFRTEYQF